MKTYHTVKMARIECALCDFLNEYVNPVLFLVGFTNSELPDYSNIRSFHFHSYCTSFSNTGKTYYDIYGNLGAKIF